MTDEERARRSRFVDAVFDEVFKAYSGPWERIDVVVERAEPALVVVRRGDAGRYSVDVPKKTAARISEIVRTEISPRAGTAKLSLDALGTIRIDESDADDGKSNGNGPLDHAVAENIARKAIDAAAGGASRDALVLEAFIASGPSEPNGLIVAGTCLSADDDGQTKRREPSNERIDEIAEEMVRSLAGISTPEKGETFRLEWKETGFFLTRRNDAEQNAEQNAEERLDVEEISDGDLLDAKRLLLVEAAAISRGAVLSALHSGAANKVETALAILSETNIATLREISFMVAWRDEAARRKFPNENLFRPANDPIDFGIAPAIVPGAPEEILAEEIFAPNDDPVLPFLRKAEGEAAGLARSMALRAKNAERALGTPLPDALIPLLLRSGNLEIDGIRLSALLTIRDDGGTGGKMIVLAEKERIPILFLRKDGAVILSRNQKSEKWTDFDEFLKRQAEFEGRERMERRRKTRPLSSNDVAAIERMKAALHAEKTHDEIHDARRRIEAWRLPVSFMIERDFSIPPEFAAWLACGAQPIAGRTPKPSPSFRDDGPLGPRALLALGPEKKPLTAVADGRIIDGTGKTTQTFKSLIEWVANVCERG